MDSDNSPSGKPEVAEAEIAQGGPGWLASSDRHDEKPVELRDSDLTPESFSNVDEKKVLRKV